MIFSDPFYSIHTGEVFVKSLCMQHEHAVANFLHSLLYQQGYHPQDSSKRIWNNGNRDVVVVLADDFGVCRKQFDLPPLSWFSDQTVIITDNHMPHETQYKICQLPVSYFGVFSYQPDNQNFDPKHRFNLCINRMDHQRIVLFLESLKQLDLDASTDLVNFNAWDPYGINNTGQDLINNFSKYFEQLDPSLKQRYQDVLHIQNQLPIRSHEISIEQAHVSAYVNLVIETYAGDASVALSEKIFRALLTPAPWTVFSAQHAVSYLKSLGFDVLDDIVDHGYDSAAHAHPCGIEKIKIYLQHSFTTYQQVQAMPLPELKNRCLQAAHNNQQLLAQFRNQWPVDFAHWIQDSIRFLQ
jgi:hypothetical protein